MFGSILFSSILILGLFFSYMCEDSCMIYRPEGYLIKNMLLNIHTLPVSQKVTSKWLKQIRQYESNIGMDVGLVKDVYAKVCWHVCGDSS